MAIYCHLRINNFKVQNKKKEWKEEFVITRIMVFANIKKVANTYILKRHVLIFHCVEIQRNVRKDTLESVKDIHLKDSACLGKVVLSTTRNSQNPWKKRISLK